jgi:hypothetical protein
MARRAAEIQLLCQILTLRQLSQQPAIEGHALGDLALHRERRLS